MIPTSDRYLPFHIVVGCVSRKRTKYAVVPKEAKKNMDRSVEVLPPLLESKLKVYPLLQCYSFDFNLLIYLSRQF